MAGTGRRRANRRRVWPAVLITVGALVVAAGTTAALALDAGTPFRLLATSPVAASSRSVVSARPGASTGTAATTSRVSVAAASQSSAAAVSDPPSSPAPGTASPTASGIAAASGPGGGAAAQADPDPATGSTATKPYRVVGLGDSVPAGSECGCTSYVTLVGQQVAALQGRDAAVDNRAQGGLTTPDVLNQVQDPAVRAELADADLVIITIGANDFDPGIVADSSCDPAGLDCYQQTLAQQASQLGDLLDQIGTLEAQHGGQVVLTGYWNVFLDGEVGREQGATYVQNSNALTLADNALIAAASSAHGDTYVDIYTPFKGDGTTDDTDLLASDGDHPNAAGHELIAQTIEEAVT